MPAKKPFKLLESNSIYKGSIVEFVKDRFVLDVAKDKVVTRVLLKHPGAVVIIPFVDPKHILLLRQFRYAAEGDLWEIPAGTLEAGENPFHCAKRELEEETGFKARSWKRLSVFYPAPGMTNELMTLYRAGDLRPGTKNLDHDEFIEHEKVSIAKALQMIKRGTIRDGKTILGILWASKLR